MSDFIILDVFSMLKTEVLVNLIDLIIKTEFTLQNAHCVSETKIINVNTCSYAIAAQNWHDMSYKYNTQ